MKKYYFILFLLFTGVLHAQLTLEQTLTPQQLTETVLVLPGSGVVPFNIKFNGSAVTAQTVNQQAAKWKVNFNPVPVLVGFAGNESGVLLTTGKASVALGPNNSGSKTDVAVPQVQGDADLALLSGFTIRSVAILEFDFVATGLAVNFDYIFASEEYLEWVGSSFNDTFGFFLSGPGITGPYSNGAKNIALVPLTTTAVSINNVNSTSNSAYYTNNGSGGTPVANPDVQYDGLTKQMRATSAIQCGGTYHIKMAIANAGDTAFDSGVFLKNFVIPPLELSDDVGLTNNTAVCFGKEEIICTGLPATGSVFVWTKDGVIMPAETGPCITVTTGGVYCVKVYTLAGCKYAEDCITITYLPEIPVVEPLDMAICTNLPPCYTFNINQTAYMLAAMPPLDPNEYIITYYNSSYQDALDYAINGRIPNANLNAYSLCSASQTIWVRIEEVNGSQCVAIKEFTLSANIIPLAPVVTTPVTYCENATALPLTAGGSNLLWYTTATGGIGDPVGPTPLTTPSGSTSYYVSQTVNGCEGPRSEIVVVVNPLPAAPTVTTPVSYCQFAVATPLTATGTGLLWYNSLDPLETGNTTAPTPITTVPGSTTYYVTQTLLGCESPRTPIVVDVLGLLLEPITAPVTYCQNAVAVPLTATGINLLWYDSLTDTTGDPVAPTPITTTVGNTTYYVSQSATGCEGPKASLVVTILPTPLAPTVVTPVTYCLNVPATQLSATGTDLLWYLQPSPGGIGDPIVPIPNTTVPGTTTYYVSQTISGCESPRASIIVTVVDLPLAPTVISPIGYCQNATAIPLTATGSGLLWYNNSVGGIGSATPPTPLTATVGSTNYYVSQTVNGCEGPRALIVVNVDLTPAAPTVTTPIIYCQNATALALAAIGTDLLWYASATGGTGNVTAPTPSTATAGSFSYYVSQSLNGCEGPRAVIVVDILPTPVLPTVITPVTYCLNAVASPLTATGTGLLWYTTAIGGIGDPIAPTPLTTLSGNTTYYVSQTINGCEGPRAVIVVTIVPPAAAPTVVSPVGYCQNATAIPLTATGSNLLWYNNSVGGIGSATPPTPLTDTVGSTNYYVSQTVNGCEGPRALIVVNIDLTPLAPIVITPITYCQNTTAVALTATGSNLLWYTVATGGTGNTSAPTPSTTNAGTFNFYVSQTTNGCEGPRAVISVVVLPTPALPIVATPVNYCQTATSVPLTATGIGLLWYTAATGGIGDPIAPTPQTAIVGSTNHYVSQTINGCEGPRAVIVVTIIPPAATPIVVSPIGYCQNATTIPLTATGSNLLWYNNSFGGIGSATPPTPLTTTVGSTNYYVSQTINGCEGARSLIVVNITATPLAPVVSTPIVYCQDNLASALTATGNNLLWYTSATGGTGSAVAPTPSTDTAGNTSYYVSQTTNGCEGPRAAIVVIVNPSPAPTLAQNGFVCVDSQTNNVLNTYILDSGLSSSTYSFEWFIIATGVPVTIPSEVSSTYEVYTPGNYGVIATNIATGCVSDFITATVGISSPPASVILTPSNYFENATITATASPAGNYEYSLDNGAFQSSNIFVNVSSGNHTVVVRDVNDCGQVSGTIEIIDYPKFFTPNGDGYNDTWNIFSLSDQPNSKIYIFDRYGKLIKEISPLGEGWDGIYNSKALPSTDYWFTVHYSESGIDKIFKAHFSLKR
jgi:gliding motility-associated-like protein